MRLVKQLRRFLADESGLEPVEYALMLVLLAIVTVVGATVLSNAVSTKFTQVGDGLDASTPTVPLTPDP